MSDIDHHRIYHDLVSDLEALAEHYEKEKDSRLETAQLVRRWIYDWAKQDGINADTDSPAPYYLNECEWICKHN